MDSDSIFSLARDSSEILAQRLERDVQKLHRQQRKVAEQIGTLGHSIPESGLNFSKLQDEDDLPGGADEQLKLATDIWQNIERQEADIELAAQRLGRMKLKPAVSGLNASISKYRDVLEGSPMVGMSVPSQRRYSSVRPAGSVKSEKETTVELTKLREDLRHSRSQLRQIQLRAHQQYERHQEAESRYYIDQALAAQSQQEAKPAESQKAENSSNIEKAAPAKPTIRFRELRARQKAQADSDADKPDALTTALEHTCHMLSKEIDQAQMFLEVSERTSEGLDKMASRYGSLDGALSLSRSLVTSLAKSQKSDTWYLETSFYLLLVTVGWLLFRRLLYGPLWWLVWFPLKLSLRLGWSATSAAVSHGLSRPSEPLSVSIPAAGLESGGSFSHPVDAVSHNDRQIEIPSTRSIIDHTSAIPYIDVEGTVIAEHAEPEPTTAVDGDDGDGGSASEEEADPEAQVVSESSDPSPESLSEEQAPAAPPTRGDGRPLEDSSGPPNPMKRMWEEPVQKKEPASQSNSAGKPGGSDKDEL